MLEVLMFTELMLDKETEKLLGAHVKNELVDEFDRQIFARGFKKKALFKAFAKWWITLPEEEQMRFYNQTDIENVKPFGEWLNRLIDERIKALVKAPKMPANEKTADQQIIEAIQNIRHFTRYHILSEQASRELQALRDTLIEKPEQKKHSKTA